MKGTSTTKFCKNGQPKHSGNFSYETVHRNSLQSKDYRVHLRDGKLIIGEHTPLESKFPEQLVWLALNDPNFNSCIRTGTVPYNGKRYEARQRLTRYESQYAYLDYKFMYREEVYTDGDFDYNFPEY